MLINSLDNETNLCSSNSELLDAIKVSGSQSRGQCQVNSLSALPPFPLHLHFCAAWNATLWWKNELSG